VTLLGKNSPVPEHYAPEILDPIPRALGRAAIGLDGYELPFVGEDVWHAWELAWLDPGGRPRTGVGRFTLPASTVNLVESKSLKLFLNSLNQTEFASAEALRDTLCADLSAVVAGSVEVEILAIDSAELTVTEIPGQNVDGEAIGEVADEPSATLLHVTSVPGEKQVMHSHVMRSLCPVTAQPDWATVVVWIENAHLAPASLLAYLAAFRNHQDYHEQCVERIFRDLREACEDAPLSVQALYTRRGGIDINPWRSSRTARSPRLRAARQ
jgi:7-cyano-7-deazaguanine reductase